MNSNMTLQNLEEMTVDLDASFKFHCTQCGKCCENRDDIILSPMDIFRMSTELKMTPAEFSMQYCRVNIGPNSRMPIVTLQPVGANDRCPLLKNQKCIVHKVKPSVCALFPLGRYLAIEKESSERILWRAAKSNICSSQSTAVMTVKPIRSGNGSADSILHWKMKRTLPGTR